MFYFAGAQRKSGVLWTDEVGFPAKQDPAGQYDFVLFPYADDPTTVASYADISCYYDALSGIFGCSSNGRSTFYACRDGAFPGGIYLSDAPPIDDGSCDNVTLRLVS